MPSMSVWLLIYTNYMIVNIRFLAGGGINSYTGNQYIYHNLAPYEWTTDVFMGSTVPNGASGC